MEDRDEKSPLNPAGRVAGYAGLGAENDFPEQIRKEEYNKQPQFAQKTAFGEVDY